LTELAVVMPMLLLILLGTIDLGQMFFGYIEMRNAVREGTAYAARNPADTAGAVKRVKDHADDGISWVRLTSTRAPDAAPDDKRCSTPKGARSGPTHRTTAS